MPQIYSGQAKRESQPSGQTSPTKSQQGKHGAIVGAIYSPPAQEEQNIPSIVPMRRGRPAASPGPQQQDASRKVTDGDPFAALDSKSSHKAAEVDELSSRFPTLDQFSLLHNKGAKFDFDSSATSPQSQHAPADQHIAERLADEAFASLSQSPEKPTPSPRPHSASPPVQQLKHVSSAPIERPPSKTPSAPAKVEHRQPSRASALINSTPELRAISAQSGSRYVSTGTMTSEFSSRATTPQIEKRFEQKLPERTSSRANLDTLPIHARPPHLRQPSLSSRPSLEDNRGLAQAADSTLRSTTPISRPRPASTSFESSTLDFLRERELCRPSKLAVQASAHDAQRSGAVAQQSRVDIESDRKQVDENLLLDLGDSPSTIRGEQGDVNRGATVVAAPIPKKLAGKFGDAFSRFEGASPQEATAANEPESPQKVISRSDPTIPAKATPTDGPSTNALIDIDEDNMTPEMRRELERQKLEDEEKRVAAAQAEYRNRVGSSGKPVPGPKNIGGPARAASTIQSRVQSLLSEDQKPSNVQKTAHGYGKYTDDPSGSPSAQRPAPTIVRKPVASLPRTNVPSNGTGSTVTASYSAPAPSQPKATGGKPPAPKKKPTHLNSFPTGARPPSPVKPGHTAQSDRLIAADLPGQPVLEMSAQDKEDYIDDFTKRFPSLSSIEMESKGGRGRGARR